MSRAPPVLCAASRSKAGARLATLRPCSSADEVVGEVTSGNFSPTLGKGIALALVRADVATDAPVAIEHRGERLEARQVPLPFIGRDT